MDIVLAILLILHVMMTILNIILDKKQQELIEDIMDTNFKLISERYKILKILIDEKIDATTSIEVLQKIEEILEGDEKYVI